MSLRAYATVGDKIKTPDGEVVWTIVAIENERVVLEWRSPLVGDPDEEVLDDAPRP